MSDQHRMGYRCVTVTVVSAVLIAACNGGAGDGASSSTAVSSDSGATSDTTEPADDTTEAADDTTEAADEDVTSAAVDSVPTTLPSGRPEFSLDAPANPASVDLTLDPDSAVAATIGAAGGTLSTTGADGTVFTLDIAEGLLFSDVEIMMTPVAAATGEAIGDNFLAAVELEPAGLRFLGAADLIITSPDLDDAVAWGSSGGQDLHLTASDQEGETTRIPVFHFSEFGLARRQMRDLLDSQGIVAEDIDARIAHELEFASDADAMRLATLVAEALELGGLLPGDPAEDYAFLEQWSSDVITHIARVTAISLIRDWGPATPGYDDLQTAFYDLVDSWFATVDDLMPAQMALCEDGNIEAAFRIMRQGLIGSYLLVLDGLFDGGVTDEEYVEGVFDAYLSPWADAGIACISLGMTWQARIVTTGDGFRSDISIGAEAQYGVSEDFDALDWLISQTGDDDQGPTRSIPSLPIETALEVEWVEGFFANPILGCSPEPGVVEMQHEDLNVHMPNLGNIGDVTIDRDTPFFVRVRIIEPITIGCTPGFGVTEEAGYPFHLGALEYLNGIFDVSGNWYLQMYYDPGGGEVGRFEQGFPVDGEGVIIDGPQLEFGTGKYELWQLATVFQPFTSS